MSSKILVLNDSSQIVSSAVFWDVHSKFRQALDKHMFYKHPYILDVTPWMIWTKTQWNNTTPGRCVMYGWSPCVYGALVYMVNSTIQVVSAWAVSKVYNPGRPVTIIGFGEYAVVAYGSTMKDFCLLLLSKHSDLTSFKKERKTLVKFIRDNNVEIVEV